MMMFAAPWGRLKGVIDGDLLAAIGDHSPMGRVDVTVQRLLGHLAGEPRVLVESVWLRILRGTGVLPMPSRTISIFTGSSARSSRAQLGPRRGGGRQGLAPDVDARPQVLAAGGGQIT